METKALQGGVIIFKEGDLSNEAYRLLSGSVEISIFVDGKKVILAQLAPGDIFGEMAMIDEHPRSATAITLGTSEVEVMTPEDFNQCILKDPSVLLPYLASFFERLRTTNNRLKLELRHKESPPSPTASTERTRTGPPSRPGSSSVALPRRDETQRIVAPEMPRYIQVNLKAVNPLTAPTCPEAGLTIQKFPFRIGRAEHHSVPTVFSSNDLVLHDEKPYQISRNHCSIDCEGDHLFIRDRGSMVGTIVNGHRIGAGENALTSDLVRGENTLILGTEESIFKFIIEVR